MDLTHDAGERLMAIVAERAQTDERYSRLNWLMCLAEAYSNAGDDEIAEKLGLLSINIFGRLNSENTDAAAGD